MTEESESVSVRVQGRGNLIPVMATLLGFHPEESLVVATLHGGRLSLTMRLDLPTRGTGEAELMAASAASAMLRHDRNACLVFVIADEPRPDVVAVVREVFGELGIHVHGTVWASGTRGGERWACTDGCPDDGVEHSGVVPEHATSEVNLVVATLFGAVTYRNRAELEALVAPVDAEVLARREAMLTGPSPISDHVDGAAVLFECIDRAQRGRLVLDDDTVATLAWVLSNRIVRDLAVTLCTDARNEQLWAALVRETPGRWAAEPAALLALSALARGNGALANVALDRAEQAWPAHKLAQLTRQMANIGVQPQVIRGLIDDLGRTEDGG